jgi:cysteine sulfinate desulfinase/cysteine desulfurase-like protein
LTLLTPDDNGHIRPEQVLNAARRNTYMVVLSHVSNVTGYTQDIAAIGNVTYKYDICLVVDAAQSAGYIPLGLKQMKARMICIPAHKGLHARHWYTVL